VGTIGGDLTDDDDQARASVMRFLDWSRGQLEAFFLERKAAGELVAKARPRELADFCISVMQGGMLLSKIRRDTEMFKNASAQAIRYVRSLRTIRKG
ncbi:MAG: Tetracyclin repressor-like, C-terminal domain, partial [Myxococcales bacterium]|nr:Tetracyclin repressor-like, C-terminal domain [Myxococcales bacterium]